MPLSFNIRHLEHQTVTLRGALPVAELDLEGIDELIRITYRAVVDDYRAAPGS